MIKLRTFTEPTNVYIIGTTADGWDEKTQVYGITDDYQPMDLKNPGNGRESSFETDGYFVIVTEAELFDLAKDLEIGPDSGDLEGCLFENFVGDISLVYILDIEKGIFLQEDEYDKNEYLMYQDKASDFDDTEYYLLINAPQGGYRKELEELFLPFRDKFKSFITNKEWDEMHKNK